MKNQESSTQIRISTMHHIFTVLASGQSKQNCQEDSPLWSWSCVCPPREGKSRQQGAREKNRQETLGTCICVTGSDKWHRKRRVHWQQRFTEQGLTRWQVSLYGRLSPKVGEAAGDRGREGSPRGVARGVVDRVSSCKGRGLILAFP